MALAEASLDRRPGRTWALRIGIAFALVALVGAMVKGIGKMLEATPHAKRQIAKIAILPDTPPPPPPPREEPKKSTPKDEARQIRPQEQPKPQAAPTEAPIKMEGAAGSGESPFTAGAVTQDYRGGTPQVGVAGASAPSTATDRAAERFYANTARQLLRDEIERQLRADAGELTATFALWVDAEGRIRRHELTASGDAAHDADMQSALAAAARALKLPPPGGLPQPMRFRLSVRPQG